MSRLYVYGLLAADAAAGLKALGTGLTNLPVECVAGHAVAALVSADVPEPIAATRRNMLAHAAVLERIMGATPLLPVRFDTVAPGRATLVACLDGHAATFATGLERIAGRIELGVKASWPEGAMSRDVLQADPALAAWRDRLAARPPAETYYERIEFGRRVEDAIATRRQAIGQEITAALSPLAERSTELRRIEDAVIINHAFLVPSANEPEFDAVVEQLVIRYTERLLFRYVGPVPPYNFVDLRADWLAPRSAARG